MQREHMHFFQDPEFPPEVAVRGIKVQEGMEECYWLPASCLRSDKISKLSPNDHSRMPVFANQSHCCCLYQGIGGNCWFVAALISLANCGPGRVKSLFEAATEDRKYVIRLYDRNGKACRITIDEFIPVRLTSSGQYQPFFVRPDGEIWPLLLEKAMAKMAGSYDGLRGDAVRWILCKDHPGRGFVFLTGATPEVWEAPGSCAAWGGHVERHGFLGVYNTPREFGEYLSQCHRNGQMMCGGTNEDGCRQVGLVDYHMYSITDVRIVEDRHTDSNLVMLEVRNTWGHTRWRGDWSDESPLWRRFPHVAKALNHRPVPIEESHLACGRFWMEITDFSRYFSLVEICRVKVGRSVTPVTREHDERRRSTTPRPPQLLANKQDVQRCPGGHVLQQFPTKNDGFSCDLCHKSVPMGTEMLSCRFCDYDLCEVCSHKRSATPRGSISPRRDLPSSPRANKHDNEKRRSVTPRRWLSPRRDLPPSSPRKKEEDEKRRATPRQSIFKSVLDVVRGRTPPPGFRKRTPPPGGRIR